MESRAPYMRFLLISSTGIMGACGLVYEYVLSVLGNHLLGSSYEEIFIIIGLMMFAMGLGAGAQRYVRGDLFDKFLLLEILLGVIGGFSAILIYLAFMHTESYRVILYAFSLTIGLLIGMEIPIIIRINEQYSLDLRANLSEILSMDYVGALAGALLFTYVLLANLSLARIGFLLGMINVSIALAGYGFFYSRVAKPARLGALILLSLAGLLFGFIRAEDWTRYAEQRYYRDPVVQSLTTKYQHIVMTRKGERLNFYINGQLQFCSLDEEIYHDLLIHPAMHMTAQRKRILILGGGDGLALREVLKYPDVESVILVDLDAEVVRLATNDPELVGMNRGAFHDARVHVMESDALSAGERIEVKQASERPTQMFTGERHTIAEVQVMIMDAERFVREMEGVFDRIFIDLPDPSELELAKLYSADFYGALRDRLAPEGLVALQSTSPYYARRAFQCIGKTLRSAGYATLPYHENVPSFGEWGWYMAWKSDVPSDLMRERLQSLEKLEVTTAYATPEVIRASLVFGKGWLDPQPDLMVNTLLNPVIIDYYRDAWKGE